MALVLSLKNLYTVYSNTNTVSLALLSVILLLVFLVARTNMPVVIRSRKKSVEELASEALIASRDGSTPPKSLAPDAPSCQSSTEELLEAPGPRPWPISGSLHLMASCPSPWEAFGKLRQIYGDVFKITLGSRKCVVISSIEAIREVLVSKGNSFSGRPDFVRYHALFGGDRDRSLALCDWSSIQKIRRRVAIPYVFPRTTSSNFDQLEGVIDTELHSHLDSLADECLRNATSSSNGEAIYSKARFSLVCANMFFRYFCSKSYSYEDKYFKDMVDRFDYIFTDINDGYALDMLPWLLPFHTVHLTRLYFYGQFIRKFLLDTLIKERNTEESLPKDAPANHIPRDFLDSILKRTRENLSNKKKHLTNDYALYELEDILGGHSAVACFFTRVLAQIIPRPDVQKLIQEEIELAVRNGNDGRVRLSDRPYMPYTQAVILETLRVTTSPIVPHVAAEDSSICGFSVKKGTLIMINNYYVNTSDAYWESPELFNPSRFLNAEGQLVKPDFFLPFGAGKRSCLGYQLLQSITFLSMVRLLQHYDIEPTEQDRVKLQSGASDVYNVEKAKLSVDENGVRAVFRPRPTSDKTAVDKNENRILVE